jgi:microcompartment protein CcmK/EutM
VLDKLNAAGEPTGGHVIAIDTVGAGYGETVIMLDEGNGARHIWSVVTRLAIAKPVSLAMSVAGPFPRASIWRG